MSGKTLYLRGMPEEIVRAAKVEAARRGVTLSEFVAGSIDEAVGGAGDAGLPEVLRADEDWYAQNKDRLLTRYEREYLAIVDGEVIDHDPEFSELSQRVFSKLGPRPILMPRCTEEDEVVDVPSPRPADD